jgi:hypothetical protein
VDVAGFGRFRVDLLLALGSLAILRDRFLGTTLGVEHELRLRDDLLACSNSVHDLNTVSLALDAQIDLSWLESTLTKIDKDDVPLAGVNHCRLGNGHCVLDRRPLDKHIGIHSRAQVALWVWNDDADLEGLRIPADFGVKEQHLAAKLFLGCVAK